MKTKTKALVVVLCALFVFAVDWGVMGIKLSMGDYDVAIEAYLGLACMAIMFVGILVRAFSDTCPHCGKLRLTRGKYCSCCGKEIE